MAEKSFVVIDGDLRLLVTPDSGWYVVSSLDIRGLNTQGKTIEEAIANAHDAAKILAEDRAEMLKEVAAAKKKAKSAKRATPTKAKTRKTPLKDKLAILDSLTGILPPTANEDEVRKERLAKYEAGL